MKTRIFMGSIVCGLFLVAAVWETGCVPSDQPTKVMVLLAGDNGLPAKADEVPLEDIQSLQVTMTQITLDSAGEGEGEGEGEKDSASQLVLFSGAKTVDLRELTGLSALISSMEIPAGIYTKIRLSIQNPVLVLTSDPDTSITDIQLTANHRLFVSSSFEIPEGQTSLVLLDLNGIHLAATGNSKYVWTPQLRASITIEPANVQAAGTIASVDTTAKTLALDVDSAESLLQIGYTGAAIFLPEDTDTATGTEGDLVVGVSVLIEGTLNVQGEMTAQTIRLLAPSTS